MTKLTLACGMSLRSFSSAAGAHVLLHSSGRGVTARSYLSSVGRCVKKRSRTCIVGETISWRSTTCLNPRVVPVMNVSARASSTYENYDATSKTYDAARFAIAKPAVERTLKDVAVSLGVPVGELVTLDAGCGTGNYSVALAELGVGRVHALDGNSSMLAHLQAKIDRAAPDSPIARALHVVKDPVNLGARSVSLPLPDASIHCAVVSQVTHHLVRAELSNPFEPVEALVAELGRVVAPGGALIIQTSTPEQQRRGFWWADIVPVAAEKLSRRFSTVSTWIEWLKQAGFDDGDIVVDIPPDPLVAHQQYADPAGPFRSDFRGWDSCWALATAEELSAGLNWYDQLTQSGRADQYIEERELIRKEVGQTTTLVGFKPL